ncbi:MAG: 1-acyl-sn-glycerol-3-phosphate acyltransferase [Thermoleophilaceae bacterium]
MPSQQAEALSLHHDRIRRRGVQPVVYWVTRAILQPAIAIWFRLSRAGREHIPAHGGVILAANHRSFLDPFAIGCCLRRPVYFVAKRELFSNRLVGWFLNCLGAFPVRRGESDEDCMATARMLLERGEAVLIFPEGTRIRSGSVGRAKRGVGRLALETGVPVVPIAVFGSDRARRGLLFRPVKVKLRFGRPLTYPRVGTPSAHLAGEVTARIWPCVALQWEWLGGLPPLRKAAVVGAGSMGTAVAELLARAGLEVQLGCRTAAQAAQLAADGFNQRYLPGVALPAGLAVGPVDAIEFRGVDLVVLAVPSRDLPAAVANVGSRIGDRSAVLVLSKGVVAPLGTLPTRYVAERVRARAVAALGGPSHAGEAVAAGASVVLAAEDPHLRTQLGDAFADAGLDVVRTDDVAGTEFAGCAKNVAALAAAAAAPRGLNAAGAVAGRVFAEVHALALAEGARSETFVGLAGTGDLVATALAEGSRNRRAGELLGRGLGREEVGALVGQAAEALDTVPLLASLMSERRREAPAVAGLAELVEGRIDPEEWVAGVCAPRKAARAA